MSGGILLGRPSAERLHQIWAASCDDVPTYTHLGSTLRAVTPLPTARRQLGEGTADFDRARAGLRKWVCHRGIGATVHPPTTPIEVGATVVVALPLGPFSVVVANRIVEVVDDAGRFGFAYGTLPGHQEQGEESFVVELREDATVVASITVDAVPCSLAARAGAPLVRRMQHRAIDRYLRAWRQHVQD